MEVIDSARKNRIILRVAAILLGVFFAASLCAAESYAVTDYTVGDVESIEFTPKEKTVEISSLPVIDADYDLQFGFNYYDLYTNNQVKAEAGDPLEQNLSVYDKWSDSWGKLIVHMKDGTTRTYIRQKTLVMTNSGEWGLTGPSAWLNEEGEAVDLPLNMQYESGVKDYDPYGNEYQNGLYYYPTVKIKAGACKTVVHMALGEKTTDCTTIVNVVDKDYNKTLRKVSFSKDPEVKNGRMYLHWKLQKDSEDYIVEQRNPDDSSAATTNRMISTYPGAWIGKDGKVHQSGVRQGSINQEAAPGYDWLSFKSSVKSGQLSKFRIRGYSAYKDTYVFSPWSKWLNFFNAKAGKVRVKSSVPRKATVTWKKVSKANGYQVFYSVKKNMKNAKKVTVKGGKKTKAIVKKLKKGKTYYVQVRPYRMHKGINYYGLKSSVLKVRIK